MGIELNWEIMENRKRAVHNHRNGQRQIRLDPLENTKLNENCSRQARLVGYLRKRLELVTWGTVRGRDNGAFFFALA